jgi:phage terminase small subunit
MAVLTNSKHEHFAQEVTKGVSATKAYVSAGYFKAGAKQNASRLITNDGVCARIKEGNYILTGPNVLRFSQKRKYQNLLENS